MYVHCIYIYMHVCAVCMCVVWHVCCIHVILCVHVLHVCVCACVVCTCVLCVYDDYIFLYGLVIEYGFWCITAWVQILSVFLLSCVTTGKITCLCLSLLECRWDSGSACLTERLSIHWAGVRCVMEVVFTWLLMKISCRQTCYVYLTWCEPGSCSSIPRVASSRPEPWPPGATSSASPVHCCDCLEVFWLWVLTYRQTREYSWGAVPRGFMRSQYFKCTWVVVCCFCVASILMKVQHFTELENYIQKALFVLSSCIVPCSCGDPRSTSGGCLVREFFLLLFCFVLRFAPVTTRPGGLFPASPLRTHLCSGEQPCTPLFGPCSLLYFAGTSPVHAF